MCQRSDARCPPGLARTVHDGGVTTTQRIAAGICGLLTTAGLVVVAVFWGRDGIETVSWVATVAALLVAVLTLWVTLTGGGGGGESRSLRFTAKAKGDARIYRSPFPLPPSPSSRYRKQSTR